MSRGWSGARSTQARKRIRALGRFQPCQRCGGEMDLDAQPWQAGHVVDRALGGSDFDMGPEHPACNMSAGGRLGNARRYGVRNRRVQRGEFPAADLFKI